MSGLVIHRERVSIHQTVEQVYDAFRHHSCEYVAVVDGTVFIGLISRGHIGFLLGTRFGFTLHSRHSIGDHLLPDPLVATAATPILRLLRLALSRTGESFYYDVPLVDEEGGFLGIIPVPALVRAQSSMVTEQIELAESRRNELQTKNQDLFRSLNQLRQSQGRYQTLFQHSPLGVALLRSDGKVEAYNTKLQSLFGSESPSEEPLPNLGDMMSPKDRATFLGWLQLHEADVMPPADQEEEFLLNLPMVGDRLFKFHTSLVRETGQICTILHDITEQRVFERRMAMNDKAALFESLVGGIAHELNNKLAPVLGFADLLESRLESIGGQEALQSFCNAISKSAQESVRIIRQLLQLSRPASMELRPSDLKSILQEAASIMRFRLRSVGATLRLQMPDENVSVLSDPAQIKQVMINLMINAADAMEHSSEKNLEVHVESQDPMAVIHVRDTGHGISADKLSRIFDPFFTTKSNDRGTGLGLSVCLGILQQHRGEISVSSTLGEGSCFKVQLPLANHVTLPRADMQVAEHPLRRLLADGQQQEEGRRINVLVVDDEEYITSLVQELLRSRLGWRVERIHDGQQAIQRLEQVGFDLVITDLRMPGLDGFAVLGWIKDFRPALFSKVLVITGDSGGIGLDHELDELGVTAIRKPFTSEELVTSCRDLLRVS